MPKRRNYSAELKRHADVLRTAKQLSRSSPQQLTQAWIVDSEKCVIYAIPHRWLKELTIDSLQHNR